MSDISTNLYFLKNISLKEDGSESLCVTSGKIRTPKSGDEFSKLLTNNGENSSSYSESTDCLRDKVLLKKGSEQAELYDYGVTAIHKLSYIENLVVTESKTTQVFWSQLRGLFGGKNPGVAGTVENAVEPNAGNSLAIHSTSKPDKLGNKVEKSDEKLLSRMLAAVTLPETTKLSFLRSGRTLNVYIRDGFSEESELITLGNNLLKLIRMKGSKLFINGREV